MSVRILIGDVFEMLQTLPDESVHCVVTSPPYWGLRDYGVEGQIGMEPTLGEHIEVIVKVCREIRRVLRKDGTFWLNYGDCYAGGGRGGNPEESEFRKQATNAGSLVAPTPLSATGLKPKDLCMLPARIAIALQDDGWWLRSEIVWCLSGGAWLYARTRKCTGPMMLKDLVRLDPSTVELWTGERWTPVVKWTRREHRADAYELVLRSGERIGCTGEHLWPTQRGNAILDLFIGGGSAKTKYLKPVVWEYQNDDLRALAGGYLEGDGHVDGGRIRLGFTRNYALERDLRCLAARLGATLTLKPTVAKNQTGVFPAFRGEWRWSRSGHHNERDRGEIVEIRRSRARNFWDVTVEDETSLFALASGVLTHNCKPNPMPESVTDRPACAHEKIFLLTKSARYWYDADAVKREAARPEWMHETATTPGNHNRKDGGCTQPKPRTTDKQKGHSRRHAGFNDRWDQMSKEEQQANGANLRNVWSIATKPFKQAHFATFPPDLIEPCIKAGCPEGGTVLDPFSGAGTTGMVADRLGRNAILIELNPEYAAMARKRIENDAGMFSEVD